jgi:peroxiredoxin
MRSVASFGCLLTVLFTGAVGAAAEPPIGKQIVDFTLRDYRGKERSLSEFKGHPVAVVFIGSDCPLAKLYALRLEAIYQEFKDKEVGILAINSNCQDTMTKVGAYARIHKLNYPVLKDPDNAVADLFEANRTPHAYVLDGDRIVRYVGRIDDQYGLGATSGYAKPKLESRYLANAIQDLLAGKDVKVPTTEPTGCIIGRVSKVEPHGDVTYSNQISRILKKRCVSCHRDGEIAPFPLTDFDEVNGWGEMMVEVIEKGQMPPWFANPKYGKFKNDCRMSEEEIKLVKTWVDNGSPEGDPANMPEPPKFAKGWRIPEPDEVHYISDKPVHVPAEGVVEYKYYTTDPGWTEDKWIKAAEARPDNREVVHHIIVYAVPPNSKRKATRHPSVAGFAPGSPARIYVDGVAKFVPAGSKLVFQMHYTPNGSPQKDRSRVGFVFTDEKKVERLAGGGLVGNWSFAIPPHDPKHKIVGERTFEKDTLLVDMLPHMHLRGKSYRYTAVYPDGKKEILLDVPNYDFNWQLRYQFVEPKLMPKGTKLRGMAFYDNSEDNLANPDPNSTVRYGDQTWEEMMHGFFGTIPVEIRQRKEAGGSE